MEGSRSMGFKLEFRLWCLVSGPMADAQTLHHLGPQNSAIKAIPNFFHARYGKHVVVSSNRGNPNTDHQKCIPFSRPPEVPLILGNPNPYKAPNKPRCYFMFHVFHLVLHYLSNVSLYSQLYTPIIYPTKWYP